MIAGVDLASAPANTAVALLRCHSALPRPGGSAQRTADGVAQRVGPARAVVVDQIATGVHDADLLRAIRGADHAGIDVPLGWPRAFVMLVSDHQLAGERAPQDSRMRVRGSPGRSFSGDESWRTTAILRTTDREVHARTGLRPLSVSADRIAYPALRWTALERVLRAEGVDCARDGSGRVSEVYPAGALHAWGLPHRGYKGSAGAPVRERIITRLMELMPWLVWNGTEELCLRDDNAMDALLAALVAREVMLGAIPPPPPQLRDDALAEGWIMSPELSPTAPAAGR